MASRPRPSWGLQWLELKDQCEMTFRCVWIPYQCHITNHEALYVHPCLHSIRPYGYLQPACWPKVDRIPVNMLVADGLVPNKHQIVTITNPGVPITTVRARWPLYVFGGFVYSQPERVMYPIIQVGVSCWHQETSEDALNMTDHCRASNRFGCEQLWKKPRFLFC